MANFSPKLCDDKRMFSILRIKRQDLFLLSSTDKSKSYISSAIFPHCFKSALVTLTVKKMCLYHNDLYNYRPVSNICLIAELIVNLILLKDSFYQTSHTIYNRFHSGYRPGHSTDKTLETFFYGLFLSISKDSMSFLDLPDFSPSFDEIDHSIHISHHHTEF